MEFKDESQVEVTRSRRMRWVEHVVHIGEITNAYNIIVSTPE
jgi:hypothetical protein